MKQFYYIYVLHNLKDDKNYTGYTKNLKYLKTHYGKMYLKNRLKHWYNESSNLI